MSFQFSLPHFREVTNTLVVSEEPYLLTKVLDVFNEITKLFHCLGQALSFATSDVVTKLEHVTNRTNEMIDAGLIKGPFETDILSAEINKGWHLSGSGNDPSFHLQLGGIEGKGKHYQNASRSIVRLVWFLDFVYEMVYYLREHPSETLQSAVKEAYNKVLYSRHNILIRNAFKVAVLVCPSKETFLEKISGELSPKEVDDIWIIVETNMKTISDKLWSIIRSYDIENVPLIVYFNK